MGLLSFSTPNKRARLSLTDRSSSSSKRSTTTTAAYDMGADRNYMYDKTIPPRLFELGDTLTASLLASPPRKPPVTPAPPEPTRTTPGDQPVGTPRRKLSLKKREPTPSLRPMSHYLPSLPPGAAAPYLGGVMDQFSRDDLDQQHHAYTTNAAYGSPPPQRRSSRSSHLRSLSASALESLGNAPRKALGNHRRSSSKMSLGSPPAIPPRSHLRALVASSSCLPSTAEASTSKSPYESQTANVLRPSVTRSSASLQYVLDVELPTPTLRMSAASSILDQPRAESEHEEAAETISFRGHYRRKKSVGDIGGVMDPISGSKDPFRVRDAKPPRSSSSGVYTPKTFPGPGVPRSPVHQSTVTSSAPTSPYQRVSGRVQSMGFKRFSVANSASHGSHAPVPARQSYSGRPLSHTPNSSMSHAPSLSYSSQVSHAMPGQSHSPSESVHSINSASPPATPTTPSSAKGFFGVVVIGRDGEDEERQSMNSMDTLGEAFVDTTPKVQSTDLPPAPTVSIPISDRTTPVPLSPDAPKRARRKPVPRLADDDVVPQLDALKL